MRRACEYRVLGEGGAEVPCGKPAVASIVWPDGLTFHYCAEHYDDRMAFIREAGRQDVLRLCGELPLRVA